jgi:hypothetical protein
MDDRIKVGRLQGKAVQIVSLMNACTRTRTRTHTHTHTLTLTQAARMLAEDRQHLAELTHHHAAAAATSTLCSWQTLTRAARHRRRTVMLRVLREWGAWAAVRAEKGARVREAAAVVNRGVLERVFFSWRWYTQVRFMLAGWMCGGPRRKRTGDAAEYVQGAALGRRCYWCLCLSEASAQDNCAALHCSCA